MNFYDILLAKKLGGGGSQPTLIEKTITANSTYNASDDNADGYSKVTVNVESEYNAKYVKNPGTTFNASDSLVELSIPEGYTNFTAGQFRYSNALKKIGIPSTMPTIPSNAFAYNNNLETITINQPEGSISGAPWGAPNATVVWTG